MNVNSLLQDGKSYEGTQKHVFNYKGGFLSDNQFKKRQILVYL